MGKEGDRGQRERKEYGKEKVETTKRGYRVED